MLEHHPVAIETFIKANDGRTKLDQELRELFERTTQARLHANYKPAFALVNEQLAKLNGMDYTHVMLDALATNSFNRANGQGNLGMGDKDRLAFRATLHETFAFARQAPKKTPRFSPTPGMTEFVPGYTGKHQKEPALLAFRYTDPAALDRFMLRFNQRGKEREDKYPFLGFGRIVSPTNSDRKNPTYVVATPHFDKDAGIYYLSVSHTNRDKDRLAADEITAPQIEHSRQAALQVLLSEQLISDTGAREAGYEPTSPGALYAKDQITKFPFEKGNQRRL
jgi:hypothetical protein